MSDDIMAVLKRVRTSVAEGGGLTSEVKALVRALRGEVLGMGRDIARRLEQAESRQPSAEDKPHGPTIEEIEAVVQRALSDLQQQMERLIRESRQRSPPAPTHPPLRTDDVYAVMKQALHEIPVPQRPPPIVTGSGLEKEEILDAVREAWETYKPEIELQNFGLERDEILECLTEGLKEG
jgi:hypothetical protein